MKLLRSNLGNIKMIHAISLRSLEIKSTTLRFTSNMSKRAGIYMIMGPVRRLGAAVTRVNFTNSRAVQRLQSKLQQKNEQNAALSQQIQQKDIEIQHKSTEIQEKNTEIQKKDAEIARLNAKPINRVLNYLKTPSGTRLVKSFAAVVRQFTGL